MTGRVKDMFASPPTDPFPLSPHQNFLPVSSTPLPNPPSLPSISSPTAFAPSMPTSNTPILTSSYYSPPWPWNSLAPSTSTSIPPSSSSSPGTTLTSLDFFNEETQLRFSSASPLTTLSDEDALMKKSFLNNGMRNEGGNGIFNSSTWFSPRSSVLSTSFDFKGNLAAQSLLYYETEEAGAANDSLLDVMSNMGNSSFGNSSDFNMTTLEAEEMSKNYWALLMIVFPLVTIFGNVLVILSVKRERSLWNVTNYFIVSLAVADLLVAAVVMPFAVYLLFNNLEWGLEPIFCDFYIAMDVTCSTSSILNLVAISIDRFIAVTQPIKYAKHKSNTRVWVTILFVWVFSGLVGSPIVLGLNSPSGPVAATECAFHNKYFVLFSSLCSFYIPCAILVFLYYRIFKVIRERAKKAQGARKPVGSNTKGITVIENLVQTKRLAETALGGPSSLPVPKASNLDDEKCTNTGSGSQDDGEDLDKEEEDVDLEGDMEGDGDGDGEIDVEDGSPDSDDCHIIANNQAATAFVLESVADDERVTVVRPEANGNHDSGYAASNMEEGAVAVLQEPSPASPKHATLAPPDQCKRNGLTQGGKEGAVVVAVPGESSSSKKPATQSRFTICKVHKASRKKREKSSAKRERKATKTLAIVLGLFLACWLPFFTCNLMDALCSILAKHCSPGMVAFLLTTWLGYVNSCLNPVIYTIFNPEFRKAFKKIMGFKP